MQGKAEDAGGLSPVKDDNAAMRFPIRRSFLIILGAALESVLKLAMSPTARDFFARRSQFDAGILDVLQGKLAMHGGKRPTVGPVVGFKTDSKG